MNQNAQTKSGITPPSLPKGGGAITGMGESLGQAGPTGMATMTIPLPVTAGRGFAPALSLSYSSGGGNDVFGLGWSCRGVSVSRRTSHGVPQYNAQDSFLGPAGEVLVPETDSKGKVITTSVKQYGKKTLSTTYTVTRYFPRTEGAFNRIESWSAADGSLFWLLHHTSGALDMLGKSKAAQISDPQQTAHIAEWLIEESVSPTGEHIWYQYKAENADGLTADGRDQSANRYLSQVSYGNKVASADLFLWGGDSAPASQSWLFTLVLDYGERSVAAATVPPFTTTGKWLARADAFSRYDFGFELRTHRLCRQVLMFHHFPDELGKADTLIHRLLLEYVSTSMLTQLTAVQSLAYEPDGTLQQLPPLELDYTAFDFSGNVNNWQKMPAMPGFNSGQSYHLVDLYGEGLAGVLYREGNDWRYRAPVRAASGGDNVAYASETVLPSVPAMQGSRFDLMDITGDGHLDWIVAQPGMAGFFTLNADKSWGNFTPFASLPVEFFHPQARLTQMVGSGLVDLALIGPKTVRMYANQGGSFDIGLDVAQGDKVTLPTAGRDASAVVAFADLLGSGQPHLIEIRYNSVSCWPNLGRGKFGEKITLPLAQPIDTEKDFNPEQLFLADIDGSGTADLVYARHNQLMLHFNQSGNSFAAPKTLALPAGVAYDRLCQITLADIQGNGCTDLVLSVPYMSPTHWCYTFTKQKPYLLGGASNNLGAHSSLAYRSSAQFWLDEKQQNPQAVCALPFPMPLLTRTVSVDEITGNTLSADVVYRQGVYDGKEREFRGFGYLETHDTNTDALPTGDNTPLAAPCLTRSWYHCGRATDETALYGTPWAGDAQAPVLKPTRFTQYDSASAQDVSYTPDSETAWWMYRCLKGGLLRSEVFAVNNGVQATVPYSATWRRMQVRRVQAGTPPVVMPSQLEQVQAGYEQLSSDPIISHTVLINQDSYGTPVSQASVAYPRRSKQPLTPYPSNLPPDAWDASYDDQQLTLRINESLASVWHLTDPQIWCLGLPRQQRQNLIVSNGLPAGGISYEALVAAGGLLAPSSPRFYGGQSEVVYKTSPPVALPALVDHTCTAVLDDVALQAYAGVDYFNGFDYTTVGYTSVKTVLDQTGVTAKSVWAVNSGFTTYDSATAFYRPLTGQNTNLTTVTTYHWDPYTLAILSQNDELQNTVSAEYDYRFLQPHKVIDNNHNTSEAQIDALGRVVGTSQYGTENGGKSVGFNMVSDYPVSPALTVQQAISNATKAGYIQHTATISVTDPLSWMGNVSQSSLPVETAGKDWELLLNARFITEQGYVRDRGRRWAKNPESDTTVPARLASVLASAGGTPVHSVILSADNYPNISGQQTHITLAYSDGFGRSLQQCGRVAAGDAWHRLADGEIDTHTVQANPRWAVSGRVEYDNKGQVIRQYQPFFVDDWQYVVDSSLRTQGYSDTHYYDALGRESHTVTALGYLRRTTWYPWFTVSEDENDTQGLTREAL